MNKKNIKIYILAFGVPIVLYCMLCILKNIYPFGDYSNLVSDLEIQYADFYAYYRQVLLGNAELSYSVSKSLGGSLVALWGYYLASPWNLLVVLFRPAEIQLFVFVVTAIKIGLCGMTLSFFIKSKYTNIQGTMVIILAVAYSFTQFVVGQMSNLNWLDGVYLLPLILWGIDRYIYEKKKVFFYLFLALSIIFNWYTGYMNCIFAILYFIYQYIIFEKSTENVADLKRYVKELVKFVWLELISVMLSLFVFLPVLLGQSGGRGAFDEGIFKFGTNGKFFDILRGFMIGSDNPSKDITLYCSIFLLLILGYYIVDRSILRIEKRAAFVFLTIMVASLFFMPLEHIWVGFKFENSYAYRFLYLTIMLLVLMGGRVLDHIEKIENKSLVRVLGGIILILLVLDMMEPFNNKHLWFEIAVLVIYVVLFVCRKKKCMQRIVQIFFVAVFFVEIMANAELVVGDRYNRASEAYVQYFSEEERLIEQVRAEEADFYRIEKTLNRDNNMQHNSFYANESMTYLYSGIQSYTSSYDMRVALLLKGLGYSRKIFPSFYHDPILPADSLLGVKYLLSENQYDGFVVKEGTGIYNNKKIYENTYALPLAFAVKGNAQSVLLSENPFENINNIYSCILGEDVELLRRINPSKVEMNEDGMRYIFSPDVESSVLYARINGESLDLNICLNNDGICQKYSTGWLNHNVVVIGNMKEERCLEIKDYYEDDLDIVFYKLNLHDLEKVSKKISTGAVKNLVIDGDKIEFESTEKTVMLTIPYDEAWEVKVNNKKIEMQKGAESFVLIPLNEEQMSCVTMRYKVKGQVAGIALSAISIVLLILWKAMEKRIVRT